MGERNERVSIIPQTPAERERVAWRMGYQAGRTDERMRQRNEDGMGEIRAGSFVGLIRFAVPEEDAARVEDEVRQSGQVWHLGKDGFRHEDDWQAWRRWATWRRLVIRDRELGKEPPATDQAAGVGDGG